MMFATTVKRGNQQIKLGKESVDKISGQLQINLVLSYDMISTRRGHNS